MPTGKGEGCSFCGERGTTAAAAAEEATARFAATEVFQAEVHSFEF